MRLRTLRSVHCAFALTVAALAAAPGCGGPGESGSEGSGGNGANGGNGGNGGNGASTGTAGNGGNTGGTDPVGGGGNGGNSSGGGGTTGGGAAGAGTQAGYAIEVAASSRAVLEESNGGAVVVGCRLLKDGLPYAAAGALPAPTFAPLDGVSPNGSTYTFPDAGTWTFSCATEIEGQKLTGEAEIAALNEAIKPSVAAVGEALGVVETGLYEVIAADGGDDKLLKDAVTKMDAKLALIAPDPKLDDVLRKVPGGYPDAAQLQAAGIAPSPDDAMLPAKLSALSSALTALRTTVAGLDPNNATMAELEAMNARTAEVAAASEGLLALKPSTHGFLATRGQLGKLLRDDVTPTTVAVGSYGSALAKAMAPDVFNAKAGDPSGVKGDQVPYFGFLSLALGMFGDSYLQIQLVNKVYGKYIEELDKSINNLILLDLLDYFFPPNADGPTIDFLEASASASFALVGYDTWAYGHNFNKDPSMNLIIVIGDQWQTIADQIFSACGIADAETVPAKVEKITECLDEVAMAADEIAQGFVTPDEVVDPGSISDQDVHMGEFPPACSGSLPLAIGLIPINLAFDRGPTYTTNCLSD